MNILEKHRKVYKPWGMEVWWARVPGKYLAKKLIIHSRGTISYHYHEKKEETLYVKKGTCYVELEGTISKYGERESFHILPGQKHRMYSLSGEVVLFEVSTDYPDDSIRIKDFYNRENE